MDRERALRYFIGKADSFELLSSLFAYPDARVAQGLSQGSIAEDVHSCLVDIGTPETEVAAIAAAFEQWRGVDETSLLSTLRVTYSELYLTPGGHTPIQPYESAFIHVERGLSGAPALFRTPITMDVEACMRAAGVLPKNARKEPSDSVSDECAYLSYLYGHMASALHDEDKEAEKSWRAHLDAFEGPHANTWLPAFMAKTQELASDTPYAAFAAFALAVMEV